ncbi:TIGR02530 family flagellar biosynthesis protein [Crassaminicella indica]|nr:TIGR02530 family flagellar biosynthesis protein [Crassaminicella indica]
MNKILIHKIHASIPKLSPKNNTYKKSFAQVLDNIASKDVKFSKHAKERMQSRNIEINNQEMNKINEALNKAKQKGIKETLILMNNKAFVASVKNRTIITVATDEQLKENIFTNIDGAVII